MNTDPSSLLLEQLTAGSGTLPTMAEVLSQLGESDPRMALLAKYFANRETVQNDISNEPIEQEQKRDSLLRLQRIMKRLYRELEALRERNDSLAAALGACYLCWGEDPQCEVCAGAGAPGSNAPDEVLLSHYVTPAIRRLRTRTRSGPPRVNGTAANARADFPTKTTSETINQGDSNE